MDLNFVLSLSKVRTSGPAMTRRDTKAASDAIQSSHLYLGREEMWKEVPQVPGIINPKHLKAIVPVELKASSLIVCDD